MYLTGAQCHTDQFDTYTESVTDQGQATALETAETAKCDNRHGSHVILAAVDPAQYECLMASGELQKHLVDASSKPISIGSTVVGSVLIAFGLMLLSMMAAGFFSH